MTHVIFSLLSLPCAQIVATVNAATMTANNASRQICLICFIADYSLFCWGLFVSAHPELRFRFTLAWSLEASTILHTSKIGWFAEAAQAVPFSTPFPEIGQPANLFHRAGHTFAFVGRFKTSRASCDDSAQGYTSA